MFQAETKSFKTVETKNYVQCTIKIGDVSKSDVGSESATENMKGLHSDAFKRAAVHYLGSRVLGYDHNASLKYSVKKFITNYDTKLRKNLNEW